MPMNDPSDIGHDHAPDHADHRDQGSPMRIASLSDPDRDTVDRLFEDGFDADAVNEGDAREDALRSLLGNLEAYPTESSSDTLVDATLAGIDRHESARRQQFTLPPHDERSPRGIHLPNFFAVAASLFLAVGIGVPLFETIRDHEQITMSQHRQRNLGQAIAGFSLDNGGFMPLLDDARTQRDTPLHGQIYSENLRPLVDGERCEAGMLESRIDGVATPMVSYRVFVNSDEFRLDGLAADEALTADPNPVIESFRGGGLRTHHLVGARRHDGDGIVVCRVDLSTPFLERPVDLDHVVDTDGIARPRIDPIWVADGYQHQQSAGIGWPSLRSDDVLAH